VFEYRRWLKGFCDVMPEGFGKNSFESRSGIFFDITAGKIT
jgi:hypothetical protein